MKSIWKFPLKITDMQEVRMPEGAKILTVQIQGETPTLWAEVDTDGVPEERLIEIVGTGNPMAYDMGNVLALEVVERNYIATIQERVFVWHIYERLS